MSRDAAWDDGAGALILETNAPSLAVAERIAEAAIRDGVAAAANLHGPFRTLYRWKGAVHGHAEWAVVFKLAESDAPRLAALIREHHPYETPAILGRPVAGGDPAYLDWMRAGGRAPDDGSG